ncbi:GTP-binding protein [Gordonia sp. (in: high G+C Gram-positive bacteria)]|uniref:CobW family GTP-binding protein n=1 Tax=Gordonia sp. (in: high G+C Gram-positive bacteria) TaxID=84139 RepID=UPI003458E227
MTRGTVPVVVLAGFLGAGKTTLLNHVLRYAGGRRIGVMVNDFGSINIDALLVSGQSGGTMNLANGCMCCTTDATGLAENLEAMADPAAGLDAILIEASGIAEPKSLIRMVLASRSARVAYGGLVYLVDGANFDATLVEHPQMSSHVALADLVVCNKVDMVGEPGDVEALVERIRSVNPSAPVLPVSHAVVDPELLFDPAEQRMRDDGARQLTFDELMLADADHGADHDADSGCGAGHGHLHAAFDSASLETDAAVDPRRLAMFLERPPAGSYRIKGTVLVDLPEHRDIAYVVQSVGGFIRVEAGSWRGRSRGTSLVVIGAGLDPVQARAALDGVVVPADPDDTNGILHLTRHLVTAT